MFSQIPRVARVITVAAFACVVAASPAVVEAQSQTYNSAIRLSGPRLGVTMFSGAAADSLDKRLGIGPAISQFGWQFERRMFHVEGGITGVHEFLVLIGGLDAGVALPSATWLLGIRGASGMEIGVGPNVSIAGLALAAGAGINVQTGGVNFPINFGVASSKYGLRTSMFIGFNTKTVGL